jgi:hypothetical protein
LGKAEREKLDEIMKMKLNRTMERMTK